MHKFTSIPLHYSDDKLVNNVIEMQLSQILIGNIPNYLTFVDHPECRRLCMSIQLNLWVILYLVIYQHQNKNKPP